MPQSRLDREKCAALVNEFTDFMESERNIEVAPDGQKLIRQFCEALANDDVVREKFDALLEDAESDGEETDRNETRRSNGNKTRGDSNGYKGTERRKAAGGFHLYEQRKNPFTYSDGKPGRNENDKRVRFGR